MLPGFINSHAHIADASQGKVGEVPPAEYVYKLWLGHSITTVREAGSFNGLRWTLNERRRSAAHEIVAPRIVPYVGFPVEVDIYDAPALLGDVKRMVAAAKQRETMTEQ